MLAVAVLLIVAGALGGMQLLSSSNTKVSVLVLVKSVPSGHVIEAADLGTTALAGKVAYTPASAEAGVVGKTAARDLFARWPVAAIAAAALAWYWPRLLGLAAGDRQTIARLEALATWTESLRDAVAGAIGLEQAIPATAAACGPAIRSQVLRLAGQLRARVPLPAALRGLAADLNDPSADLVVARPARPGPLRDAFGRVRRDEGHRDSGASPLRNFGGSTRRRRDRRLDRHRRAAEPYDRDGTIGVRHRGFDTTSAVRLAETREDHWRRPLSFRPH